MAELIPPLNSCLSRMQSGEKRFARRLDTHLEDDYLCWYEIGVGKRPRYTDFVILHPMRGLLLLEVKDWDPGRIRRANPESFELETQNGLKNFLNPIKQARLCAYKLKEQLERDPQLVHTSGEYKGKLIMPYGYGVVFTRISRSQFQNAELDRVIPEHLAICKDEMLESTDVEDFQKCLWDMFDYCFNRKLSQPQIDRIRWHMLPEIRRNPQPELQLSAENVKDIFDIPDIIQVMDLKQEKLARGLGTGHRVIHGVAGSGKTMILCYRCLHLAKLLHKPILVLCYNVTLAARLRELIEAHEMNDRVNVYSIHNWANTILKSYNFSPPNLTGDNYDASIEKVIEQVSKGQIPRGQYGAILIDEGHDFKPEWLRLVVDMVDPESNSLLLLYDDMQSIYKRSSGLGFTLKDVGIEAQGRSTILKLNYRNTEEVLKFAFDFVDDYVRPSESDDGGIPIVKPDSAGRRGALPVLKNFDSFEGEAQYIAKVFKQLHVGRGVAWSEMCVLYCHKWMGKAVAEVMKAADIPFTWRNDSVSKRRYCGSHDPVKLITMHSSKGLEFSTVATCGIGSMGTNAGRIEDEAKLLYVAMTRATENLLLTSSRSSPFSTKLAEIVNRHKKDIAA